MSVSFKEGALFNRGGGLAFITQHLFWILVIIVAMISIEH